MELVWGKMKTPNLPYRLVAMRYKTPEKSIVSERKSEEEEATKEKLYETL